jgi:hypothetical protein
MPNTATLTVNTSSARRATVVHYAGGATGYRLDGIDYLTADRCRACGSGPTGLCAGVKGGHLGHPHAGRVLIERTVAELVAGDPSAEPTPRPVRVVDTATQRTAEHVLGKYAAGAADARQDDLEAFVAECRTDPDAIVDEVIDLARDLGLPVDEPGHPLHPVLVADAEAFARTVTAARLTPLVDPRTAGGCACAGCRGENECIGEGSPFWTSTPAAVPVEV